MGKDGGKSSCLLAVRLIAAILLNFSALCGFDVGTSVSAWIIAQQAVARVVASGNCINCAKVAPTPLWQHRQPTLLLALPLSAFNMQLFTHTHTLRHSPQHTHIHTGKSRRCAFVSCVILKYLWHQMQSSTWLNVMHKATEPAAAAADANAEGVQLGEGGQAKGGQGRARNCRE